MTQLERRTPLSAEQRQFLTAQGGDRAFAGLRGVTALTTRYTFDRASGDLIRSEDVAATATGDVVVGWNEWVSRTVMDARDVPAGTLTPTVPALSDHLTPVATARGSVLDASRVVPFEVYALDPSLVGATRATASYTAGQHLGRESLPVHYRGVEFAVQRGDAAGISYDGPRPLSVIQGPASTLAASLRAAPAFWKTARAVTLTIDGTRVSGWFLSAGPVSVRDLQDAPIRQVEGAAWVLVPDLKGTAILLMARGYPESEMLSLAERLRRTS